MATTELNDRWVDTEGAANHTSMAVSTLEKLRTYGGGPRYSKQGRSVRYRLSDLDRWMEAELVIPAGRRAR